MRTKHKLGLVFLLLLSLILLPSVSADCYVWTIGDSCDVNKVFWDSSDYVRLSAGVEREDWNTIKDKTTVGLNTDCYSHIINGQQHTLTCDRTASEIGSFDFLTYFKNSNVKDLSITEIVKETKTQTYYPTTGMKEVECVKGSFNETKGLKCFEETKEQKTNSWIETREQPITLNKEGVFDYKASSKADFTKDQKRTYRIEWRDKEPIAKKEVMQGDLLAGTLSFPAKEFYSNELKINPIVSYNSTQNNWGGKASNSDLDASNNITALLSGGGTVNVSYIDHNGTSSDNTASRNGYNGIRLVPSVNQSVVSLIVDGAGSTHSGATIAYVLDADKNVLVTSPEGATSMSAGYEINFTTPYPLIAGVTYYLVVDKTSENRVIEYLDYPTYANPTFPKSVDHGTITGGLCNGGGGSTDHADNGCDVVAWRISISSTSSPVYSISGNRTLDGFCPDLPNQYDWSNATLESWNSGSNAGNMTIKFSNDNSTWIDETPFANLQMIKKTSACVQFIPNVTTTGGTTTPKISGATINYKSLTAPKINIEYPINGVTYYVSKLDLNISVYDADGINTLWYDNLTINTTINYPANTTLENLTNGAKHIIAYVNDTDGNMNRTEVSFTINLPPTTPSTLAPANNSYNTTIPTLRITASTDTDPIQYYFEIDSDPSFSSAETSGLISSTSWTPTITEGHYYWRVLATDGYGNSSWSDVPYFTYDATAPAIYLVNPTNTTYSSATQWLNFTAIDSNLNKITYNLGGVNVSITANTSITFAERNNTITLWANDSAGNTNSTSINFFVNVIVVNVTYESPVIESQPQSIYLNASASQLNSLNGTLFYNNTAISPTATYNATYGYLKATFTTPLFNSTNSVPLYWNYTINGVNYLSNYYNQSITHITPLVVNDSCSVGLSPAMCFGFNDEVNLTKLSADITYNFLFGAYDTFTQAIYGSKNNTDNFCLCINATAYNNYTISNGEIHYYKTGYSDRNFYTFSNNRISNSTINNSLYLLPSASATSFLFEFKTTSLANYVGKYASLLRWYPDLNEYKVVEMGRTDNKGQTIMRVEIEDVDYRVGLYETTGELIKLLNATRFTCLSSPCSYSTQIATSKSDYTSIFGVETSIDYNEGTHIWTYIWNDPSQKTNSMRFKVTRERGDSSTTICDTIGSGTTGVLNCDSSGYTGTLVGKAYRTASPETPIETPIAQTIIDTLSTPFRSSSGLFISFIILVLMAFIGIFSPIAVIVLGLIGLVVALKLGVITTAIFIAVGALFGIVIHFLKRT